MWTNEEIEFLLTFPDCISGLDVYVKFIDVFPNTGKSLKDINKKLEEVKKGIK